MELGGQRFAQHPVYKMQRLLVRLEQIISQLSCLNRCNVFFSFLFFMRLVLEMVLPLWISNVQKTNTQAACLVILRFPCQYCKGNCIYTFKALLLLFIFIRKWLCAPKTDCQLYVGYSSLLEHLWIINLFGCSEHNWTTVHYHSDWKAQFHQ